MKVSEYESVIAHARAAPTAPERIARLMESITKAIAEHPSDPESLRGVETYLERVLLRL